MRSVPLESFVSIGDAQGDPDARPSWSPHHAPGTTTACSPSTFLWVAPSLRLHLHRQKRRGNGDAQLPFAI